MDWMKEFASYEDAFINDLRGLIRIDSVRDDESAAEGAPFGKGCRAALDYMLQLAKCDGFETCDYDGYAGVISYGHGDESVGVLAHLDIVPIGDGWTKDPFGGEIEKGYLFGRGALDDKGPAMAGYYAMKMLRDKGIMLDKKVMLILGCDEESGMECMTYYAKHGEIPTLGFTPDADFPVIYGEKGGLHVRMHGVCDTAIEHMCAGDRPNIVIGKAQAVMKEWSASYDELFDFYLDANELKGMIRKENGITTLCVEGTSAHGAMPYHGVNAALHLLNFVGTACHDTFAKTTYHLLHDWMGKPLGINMEGAHMGFLTVNTGRIHIEDDHADLLLDIRYPQESDVDEMDSAIHHAAADCHYPLQIDVMRKADPLFVDPASKLVTTLSDVYRKYSHDMEHANVTIGGGTYAKKFKNFVAFGPEFPDRKQSEDLYVGGPHQKDEGILLSDLYMAIAIYTESIEKLAKNEVAI